MIVQIEIKPNPRIYSIAEISLNQELPEFICRFQAGVDDKIVIRSLDSVISGVKNTPSKSSFSFSSDRILDAASRYYIVHDPSIRAAGAARTWKGTKKRYAAIQVKSDPATVIHELIHLAYYHRPRKLSDDFDDKSQYDEQENALEIATELLLYHVPRLAEDLRDAQVKKVLRTLDRYNFSNHMKTPNDIDYVSLFFRESLEKESKALTKEQEFDYNGTFNNCYWEDIRAALIGGNFQVPIRQRFLFGM